MRVGLLLAGIAIVMLAGWLLWTGQAREGTPSGSEVQGGSTGSRSPVGDIPLPPADTGTPDAITTSPFCTPATRNCARPYP